MTEIDALDALPIELRERIKNGWYVWSAYSILRQYRKWAPRWGHERTVAFWIDLLDKADIKEASRP